MPAATVRVLQLHRSTRLKKNSSARSAANLSRRGWRARVRWKKSSRFAALAIKLVATTLVHAVQGRNTRSATGPRRSLFPFYFSEGHVVGFASRAPLPVVE